MKIWLPKALLLALMEIGALSAVAQDTANRAFRNQHHGFFNLLFTEHSDFTAGYLYQPKQKLKGGGKLDLHSWGTKFELPFASSRDSYLRLGAEFEERAYNFKDGAAGASDSEDIYKAVLLLGAGEFLSEDILITGAVRPGIYTDFDSGWNTGDMRVYGEALVVYRVNPGAQLVGGLEYSEIFDDMPFYPLLGLRLMSTSGMLHLSATFPKEVRIAVNVSPQFQLYTGAWVSGEEYRILMSSEKNFDLHIQERRWGMGLIYWPLSWLNIKLEGGLLLGGKVKFKSQQLPSAGGDSEMTGYVTAGAGLAF